LHPPLEALAAWRSVVGAKNLLSEAAELGEAEAATFGTAQRITAIIRPADRAEVEECVRVANRYRAPIYPVSRGRNWGLGSRVPARTGCAVLDLARLDRIVDFDEKLAYITVQPGVTFRQVDEFLRERQSKLFAAVTGGPPDGSLVGNALERGEGSGPYGDRAAHICGFEVVLPTGETIRTGFGRFGKAKTVPLSPWGVGASLDGLFVQSSFGIVTELTVWLHPRPRYLEVFDLAVADTGDLAPVVDAIQPLVLNGTIASQSFGLWNAYKRMSIAGRYPWSAMQGKTPLLLRDRSGCEPWSAVGALYAPSASYRTAGRKSIQAACQGLPQTPHFESAKSSTRDVAFDLWRGIPTVRNLRSMYWRKKNDPTGFAAPFDPHRDGCGVMWVHPVLPFSGEHVVNASRLMESVTASHGFEPLIGMSCPSGRRINVYLALMYDRAVAGEDERAMACHDDLLQRLTNEGYPPYRLGIQSMRSVPASQSPYEDVLRRLKAALDPNDIIAPGRYDFQEHAPKARQGS
jgi:4-cresol dehydrogenase (hydroxylating)